MSAKFVVVGGGIAGVTCAETVNQRASLPNTGYFKILHLQVLAFQKSKFKLYTYGLNTEIHS